VGRGAQAGSRLAVVALAAAGLGCGIAVAAVIARSDHVDDRGLEAALALLVGWSFISAGLFAWWRRPANRTGALMAAVGFSWLASRLGASDGDALYTAGIALDALFPAVAGHLLLAFPSGRLGSRAERATVVGLYLLATVLQAPALLFEEHVPGDPRNLLVVEPDQDLSDVLDAMQFAVALVLVGASFAIVLRRWLDATPRQRRVLAPVIWTGGAALSVFAIAMGFDAAGSPQERLEQLSQVLLAAVPFGFLAGLLRSRLAQGPAVSGLIARLGQAPGEEELRDALADALGDPSLALAYWLPESSRFVDAGGRPVTLPGRAWTPVELHGERVAALVHEPSLVDEPGLVTTVGTAAALALENRRLSAELHARIEELRASRARLVEASDTERRRLERNLHDGAQSRLVALALKLSLTQRKVEPGSDAAAMLEEAGAELRASLDELRELARGLNPVVLHDRGLDAALRVLADRAPVPVETSVALSRQLPPPIETAVYFVVAEALTNVAKYAQASHATVSVTEAGGAVAVEVADDGAGGADITAGSGLRGLNDRVAALEGRLDLSSPPGGGTRLRAELPLER